MQLRLVQRLLRLDNNRNTYVPDYQQYPHLEVVVDTQDPTHREHGPNQWQPSLPVKDW
jgi:hypothetical protein